MRRELVPFDGTPPNVRRGEAVECRTLDGNWFRATANSGPRYDQASAHGPRCYLTVEITGSGWTHVNWPAEDVRPAQPREAK